MGLKAPKPVGNKVAKSTQRIVLPAQKTGPLPPPPARTGPLGTQNQIEPTMRIMIPGKVQGAAATISAAVSPDDKISLPVSIAFRSLPPSVLSDQAQMAVNPTDEFSIPLHLIVPQLPLGKIEFSVQQMIGFLPQAMFKSPTEIAGAMESKVMLPMMEVFTRIPADKLQGKQSPSPATPSAVSIDAKKTRPMNPLIPPVPPAPMAPPVPAAPSAAKPPAPLIPPPAPRMIPPAPPTPVPTSVPPASAPTLDSLLAAAESALGDAPQEDKTVPMPPSQDSVILESPEVPVTPVAPVIPPPPPRATVPLTPSAPTPTPTAPPLEVLLQAAQEALADIPQGDQTVMVQELQEDKIEPIVPFSEPPVPVKIPEPVLIETPKSDSTPPAPVEVVPSAPEKEAAAPEEVEAEELDLNRCLEPQLIKSVRCSEELAKSIISYRQIKGGFSKLEDLLHVPGMTDAVFYSLTGQRSEVGAVVSLNEILNLSAGLNVTVDQALARVALWPGIRGCLVQKGTRTFGELSGLENREKFIAQAQETLRVSESMVVQVGLVREVVLRDAIGSWIILQRGSTVLISGFQGGMIPEAMKVVLEKITVELHERIRG
jgi:hypothetical protein